MIDVTISVPWYPCLSKNRTHYMSRRRNPATVAAQTDIANSVKAKILPWRWDHEKAIRVDIVVFFERKGTDVHNFVDAIMDALEDGTGVNDAMMRPVSVDGWRIADGSKPGFAIRLMQR